RPVILNSIEEIAARADLLDRSLIIYSPRIPEERRRDEKCLQSRFELDRPVILAALLTAISRAMRTPTPDLQHKPRMLDAALWVGRAEPAFGWPGGTFAQLYSANAAASGELPLETPVVEALRNIGLPWEGTATELLGALEIQTDERARRSKAWPQSPRSL